MLDSKGIGAALVGLVIAASLGGTFATAIAVDAADVDPDHPLYALERLGERLRGTGIVSRIKERWGEYARVIARGKAALYHTILMEFRDELKHVLENLPENARAKQEIIRWIRERAPELGRLRLRVLGEACKRLLERLENRPELAELIENLRRKLAEEENAFPDFPSEAFERLRAKLQLIKERLKEAAQRLKPGWRPFNVYINVDDIFVDVDITIDAHRLMERGKVPVPWKPTPMPMPWRRVKENLRSWVKDKLTGFENEISAVLEEAQKLPDNSRKRKLAESLVTKAVKLKQQAIETWRERPWHALRLLHRAQTMLRLARRVLELGLVEIPEPL